MPRRAPATRPQLLASLLRKRAAAAAAISLTSVTVAFLLGVGLALLLYSNHSTVQGKTVPQSAFVLFLGAAMSITAFPVLARILTDRKLIHTAVGALALASAVSVWTQRLAQVNTAHTKTQSTH